jgi:hypothetical protein
LVFLLVPEGNQPSIGLILSHHREHFGAVPRQLTTKAATAVRSTWFDSVGLGQPRRSQRHGSSRYGFDLLAIVTDHNVVIFVERVVILIRERLRVSLDQPLIVIDGQESFAHFGTFG